MIQTKKLFLSVLITCYSLVCIAQQVPHYTQYLYNMQVLNPAAVGARSDLNISLLTRQQWVGVTGAPTTNTLSINGRTNSGIGIGATIINDKLGLTESTNINVDASYTIITSIHSRLAFGLKGGLTYFNNKLAQGITPDNDTYNNTNGNTPNIGFGAYFYNKNYFIGLSAPHLLQSKQFLIQQNGNTSKLSNNINYFATAGIRFQLSETLICKPSTIIKHTNTLPLSIDINTNFLYKNYLEAGLSYRYNDAASILFALIINQKYRIGYAYDKKLNTIANNFNTHEIILHVDFDLKRKGRWLEHNSCYF
ncbi:type IX secretion system membrane protein PorP/SprF [Tenacibaculum aestuariivivum]|uniref:PorP/SprF family type IX secretion system membrane protein n=1 Tax=Tenacibaculum aestuariivivum TaxID=2006131 RepID=UPI003AB6A758